MLGRPLRFQTTVLFCLGLMLVQQVVLFFDLPFWSLSNPLLDNRNDWNSTTSKPHNANAGIWIDVQSLERSSNNTQTTAQLSSSKEAAIVSSDKAKLWIHVGPPKTGTTTIQSELAALQPELNRDGYQYSSGVFVQNNQQRYFFDQTCQKQLAQVRFEVLASPPDTNVTSSKERQLRLYQSLVQVPCWKQRLDLLKSWSEQGKRHVILSNEAIGFRWIHYQGLSQPTHADWISIKATLEPLYDIHVIVTYRRYYDWLVSSVNHQNRWVPSHPRRNKWPGRPQNGKPLISLYPAMLNPDRQKQVLDFYPTSAVLRNLAHYFSAEEHKLHVLNMHNDHGDDSGQGRMIEKSMVSTLLCRLLPDTHYACQKSRAKDNLPETRVNARTDHEMEEIVYDFIVTGAAQRGLLDIQGRKRHEVALKARHFYQVERNQTLWDSSLFLSHMGRGPRTTPTILAHGTANGPLVSQYRPTGSIVHV